MAHFAKIENGLVTQVIVVGDEYELTFADNKKNDGETWVQTSYNNNIRFNFAGIGYAYDETLDAFIPPKCHAEAVLNVKCLWDCSNSDHDPILS
jgi:hypothetical protein